MSRQLRRTVTVVIAAVIGLSGCGDDEPTAVGTATTESPTLTTALDPTATTGGSAAVPTTLDPNAPTTTPPPQATERAVWPLDDRPRAGTAAAVAVSFANDFLGMPGARAADPNASQCCATTTAPQPPDPTRPHIVLQPFDTGGPRTTVALEAHGDGFVVVGTTSDAVAYLQPFDRAVVSSPVHVTGGGTAYEGQLNYKIYRAGTTTDIAGGDHIVMAGSNGEFGEFDDTIPFTAAPGTDLVLILFEGDASGRGEISAATVIRIAAA